MAPALAFDGWTANDWTALGTCAYALIAGIAAVVVYFQVREARRTREDQARPFVIVDIQPSPVWWNIFNLVIENVGTTLARDVAISFTPELSTSQKDYDLANSALIKEGIPSLPPRRRIQVLFDVSHERKKTDLPMRYEAEVSFKDARGRQQESLRYVIDLGYLYGLHRVEEYGLHHAAKALREINSTMQKWTGRQGRLDVWTRDEDRDNLEDQIEYAMTGHYPSMGRKGPPELALWAGRSVVVRELVRWLRERRKRNTP